MEEIYPLVDQWITAFNSHDVPALLALYTDDAELYDAGMKHARRGRDAISDWFTTRFHTMPTITYTPTSSTLLATGLAAALGSSSPTLLATGQVAITWTACGRGPRLLGQSWLARPFQVDGVSIFTLHANLILRQRGYYDHLTVVEQILPPLKWLLPSRL